MRNRNKDGTFKKIHGEAGTRTWCNWNQMKQRCFSPNNSSYFKYGARGISVCKKWLSYQGFLADMGHSPRGMTLERINNSGNYWKGNCKWATPKEQANNRRSNRLITFENITMTLAQWSEKLGIKSYTLRRRIVDGWSIKEALYKPVKQK